MGQSTNMKMPFQTNIKETHVSVSIAAVFCERVDALTGDSFSSFIFNRRFAPSSPPGGQKCVGSTLFKRKGRKGYEGEGDSETYGVL